MHEVSGNSVLMVDDNPFDRRLVSMQLARARFEVQEAEDGIDALAKLRHKLPRVVISDIQMPRMSGVEFISVMRRRFPFIPIIVLSGSRPFELPAEAKPDRWFDKNAPHLTELVQAVHELAKKTPGRGYLPQVISLPIRTRPGGAGYFVLTCPDCLRLFQVASTPENKTEERTAACAHCEARVPFLIESSEPA
jgi:CheY-like chemotaxis protein